MFGSLQKHALGGPVYLTTCAVDELKWRHIWTYLCGWLMMIDVRGVKLFVRSHGCLSLFGIRTSHISKGGLILPNWISVGRILFGNHVVEPTSEFCTSVVCCCWVLTFFQLWASIWKLGGCPTTNHEIWDRILEVVYLRCLSNVLTPSFDHKKWCTYVVYQITPWQWVAWCEHWSTIHLPVWYVYIYICIYDDLLYSNPL